MKNIFDTKTVTFTELLGNGKIYKIPSFQRDFSWTEENWEDLWNDIIDIYQDNEEQHYMGTIVLQNTENKKEFIIVDGQQRVTTLSIFILAIVKILKNLIDKNIDVSNNQERVKKILNTYIGEKSLSDLYYRTKLTLNDNNNNFYKTRLLEFKELTNKTKLRDSEKLLFNCFEFFEQKIQDYFDKSLNGSTLGGFLEKISDNLIFILITVDDDVSAYTVFETLNARGVELTTTDLLKNYLFSLVASAGKDGGAFKILQDDWKEIVDIVNLKKFPTFLRFYINSYKSLVRKERLFKEIKKEISTPIEAVELIEELKSHAYLYSAILNPNDDFWNENPHQKEIRKSLSELKLFGVTQPISLLFSIYNYKQEWFSKILKVLVSISFRYNVIAKFNPNSMEKVYNTIAIKINKGEISHFAQIKDLLNEIYVDDDTFFNLFKSKSISTNGRSKTIVKYILTTIENQIYHNDYNINDSNFTIEHILPENYTEEWNENFSNEAQKYVYRLGNYTLLEEKKNKIIGNKPFDEKKKVYKESRYKITSNNLNYESWNIDNLIDHQVQFAKYAKSIWKI